MIIFIPHTLINIFRVSTVLYTYCLVPQRLNTFGKCIYTKCLYLLQCYNKLDDKNMFELFIIYIIEVYGLEEYLKRIFKITTRLHEETSSH